MSLKDEMESKILTSVKINNVPIKFWNEEFKPDCEANFANNYIMKIMVDHYRRVSGDDRIAAIVGKLEELEKRVEELEGRPAQEQVEKVVKTFGGI